MAKPAKKQDETENPKKKRSFASYKKKRKTRAVRANPAPRKNPGVASDIVHVGAGFAAYGITRAAQRIVYQVVGKRWPKWAKWAHAATGIGVFGAVWWGAHRVKALAPYHDAAMMGSGIAAGQGVLSSVLSAKYTWLLSDCKPEDLRPAPQQQMQQTIARSNNADALPDADNDEYSDLEAQLGSLAGGPARSVPAPRPQQNPVASTLAMATAGQGGVTDPDLMEELGGENLDDLYAGAFANN